MTVMEVGLLFIYFFFQLDSLLAGPFSVFFYYISYPFPQKIETAGVLLVVLICLEISLPYLRAEYNIRRFFCFPLGVEVRILTLLQRWISSCVVLCRPLSFGYQWCQKQLEFVAFFPINFQ